MLRSFTFARFASARAGLLTRLTPEQRAALAARAERPPGGRVAGLDRVPSARPPPRAARASPYADVDRDEDDVVTPMPPPALPLKRDGE